MATSIEVEEFFEGWKDWRVVTFAWSMIVEIVRAKRPQSRGGDWMRFGRGREGLSALHGAIAATVVMAAASSAMAQGVAHDFNLPPGDLADALRQIGDVSEIQLLFSPALVAGRRSSAVRGRYSVEEALKVVLARTDLSYRKTAAGVVVIVREPVPRTLPSKPAFPAASRGADNEPIVGLEAVTVTSAKRAVSLQHAPMSVAAITNATLERAGVSNFEDLIKVAPSLTISKTTQPGNNSISVRGAGTYAYSIATEPSVVVVVDDVPQAFQAMAFTALTDIQQVEVLRGPQSTLFGKASSAGVIFITTQPAADTFAARIETLVTDDHEQRLQAMVTGPLGAEVKARLAASYSAYRGNVFNLTTGEWLNGQSDFNLRAKVVWTPVSQWSVTLSPYFTRTLASCCVSAPVEVSPGATFGLAAIPRAVVLKDLNPAPGNHFTRMDVNARGNATNFGSGLRVERATPAGWRLTSVTSIDDYYLYDRQDTDGSDFDYSTVAPGAPIGGSGNGGYFKINSFSQELRLNSPPQARLGYVAGVYYGQTRSRRDFTRGSNTLGDFNGLPGLPATNSIAYSRYVSRAYSESLAAFGQGAFALDDRTSLQAGLRVSRESIGYTFEDLGNHVAYGAPRCSGQSPTVPIRTCNHDTAVTGRVGLERNIGPGLTGFAAYSTGYKGMAYDLTSTLTIRAPLTTGPWSGIPTADAIAAAQPVAPETVTNSEIGLRAVLADRRLTWNLTLYREVFEGFQAQSRDEAAGVNALNSVGQVVARGVESEFSAKLTPRLSLNGAMAYSRAIMERFEGASCYVGQTLAEGCVDGRQNLSGRTLFNAPRWSLHLNAFYQRPLGDDWTVFGAAGYRWKSRVFYSLLQDPDSVEPSYGLADVSVGLSNHRWKITAFVSNVFDQSFALTRGRDLQWNFNTSASPPIKAVNWKPARDSGRHAGLRVAIDY
jgi:iron complex outermembrane receptor protein